LNISLGTILKSLGTKKAYVLVPLDDGLIDNLLERSPKLIKECREIRARMAAGQFGRHEQLKKRLGA